MSRFFGSIRELFDKHWGCIYAERTKKNISLFLLCMEPWHILCINIRVLYSITIKLSYHHYLSHHYVSPIIFPPIICFPPLSLLHYLPSSSIFPLFYVIPIIFNMYEPYYICPTILPYSLSYTYICPIFFPPTRACYDSGVTWIVFHQFFAKY